MEKDLQVAENKSQIHVTPEECGQKLLKFLQKRFGFPESLLHRWIRTGQIRVNGCRIKPFARLNENDLIRVPPFKTSEDKKARQDKAYSEKKDSIPSSLNILEEWNEVLFINKPAGLAVHGGTGQKDSVNSRLAEIYKDSSFKPVAAHRLDLGTSGVLLAGLTWRALQDLQKNFASRSIKKEYLAWVHNQWNYPNRLELKHFLAREKKDGFEKTCVYPEYVNNSLEAYAVARCLFKNDNFSLLHLDLHTGIKHQLRAQLAYLGHPIVGDNKYGIDKNFPMLLHSFRISLPDNHKVTALPDWEDRFTVFEKLSSL